MTQISQVYILPLWISDHLHETFKNLNIPFLFSKSEFNTWYAFVYLNIYFPFVMECPVPREREPTFSVSEINIMIPAHLATELY